LIENVFIDGNQILFMKNLVIVVSGPPGVGSSTIAKVLAERLRLRYFSPGKIFKSHENAPEAKAALDVWSTGYGKNKNTHRNLDDIQTREAKRGNVVICGKLSIHFLKDLADYKIWIDAPLEVRAKRAAGRDKVPVETVMKQIKEREDIERNEWKKIYGFDYLDQKNSADLVIDNSELNVNETVKKILNFIKHK